MAWVLMRMGVGIYGSMGALWVWVLMHLGAPWHGCSWAWVAHCM